VEKLLRTLVSGRYKDAVVGDFVEIYRELIREKGKLRAKLWLFFQVVTSLPDFVKQSFIGGIEMMFNHIKLTLRNLKRHKSFSFINISGLAVGFACSMLIFLWVKDELSYDRFHVNASRIHRVAVAGVINDTEIGYTLNPLILGETLANDFPEVEAAMRIYRPRSTISVRYKEKVFTEPRVFFVEKNFFQLFSFPFQKGDAATALEDPSNLIMTQSTALKYFGIENPIDRSVELGGGKYKVGGVITNVPHNSHFQFDILIPLDAINLDRPAQWMNNYVLTYILLKEDRSPQQVQAKFPELVRNKIGDLGQGNRWAYYLQALTDIHLNSHIDYELGENGNITYVRIFAVVAVFILIIAAINFINLTTARASKRAKEVGIRKVAGSFRGQLIRQFLSESILLSYIALFFALVLLLVFLPIFCNLVVKPLTVGSLFQPGTLFLLLGITLLVGILSGSYPAFMLSSFQPAAVIKGNIQKPREKISLRNVLVIFQFSVTVFLIVCTLVINKQLDFMHTKKLGFDREQVLVIKNPNVLGNRMESFKLDLLQQPFIENTAVSSHLPGYESNFIGMGFTPQGLPWVSLETWTGDENVLDALRMELVTGRFFSPEFPSDKHAIILNEAAVRNIGWKDPVGKILRSMNLDWHVIGVVKDMHYQSMQYQIRPMGLLHKSSNFNNYPEKYLSVRLGTDDVLQTIATIERIWEKYSTGFPLEYSFLDDAYNNLYINEQRTSKLSLIFSTLAIVIAALGLFGLASFIAIQKTKEIGIRKVLGASVPGIAAFLAKGFLWPIFLANIFAIPLVIILMNNWLNNFAYHIDIPWWMFALSVLFSLLVALLTVSYQTIKAAVANPVNSLRYE